MTKKQLASEVSALRNLMGQFIDAMRHQDNRLRVLEDRADEANAEREADGE